MQQEDGTITANLDAEPLVGEPANRTWVDPDATRTDTGSCGDEEASRLVAGEWPRIGGRYQVLRQLGMGGGGSVYAARDERTGQVVAVKLIQVSGDGAARRARREVAALRYLRIPGVVRLLDDGFHRPGERFLVMDLLAGEPWFSGDRTWADIEAPFLALLDTLARVHALGILHLDLKPGNVILVGGRPVVLDFGISLGRALATPDARIEGRSAGFTAPDPRPDHRADLYAAGRMALVALTPRGEEDPVGPPHVLALLRRMTARDRDDRPGSAEEVLEALGGTGVRERVAAVLERLPSADPVSAEDLRVLFRGPDVYLHLREDGAALLHARTGGVRAALGPELERWVRSGRAAIDGAEVVVDRIALDRLARVDLDVSGRPAGELLADATTRARALRDEGRHSLALADFELALAMARTLGDETQERSLLAELAEVALASESKDALDPALYEVERSGVASAAPIGTLLRAGQAVLDRDGPRARDLLAGVAPLPDEALEEWQVGLMARALDFGAGGAEEAEAFLASHKAWAEARPSRRGRWQRWLGTLRYSQGRYAEAAELAEASAELGRPAERIAGLINAAFAWNEVDPKRGAEVARAAAQAAERLRLAQPEAMATTALRMGTYRIGVDAVAERELVAPAVFAVVGPRNEATALLCEAAFAWRAGMQDLTVELARRSAVSFTHQRIGSGAALAACLAYAAGDQGDPAALASGLERLKSDELAAQGWALLLRRVEQSPVTWMVEAERRLRALSHLDPHRRLDILSPAEIAAALLPPE